MEQLISTPLRPSELVLGKMSTFFALGCVDTILAILAGVGVFGVPLRGSLVFLALTSGIFLFGALCWGILISSIARSQLLAYQMGSLTTFLPGFLLSGFIFAIDNMPPAIQTVSYLVPARYFVRILKGIFLKDIGRLCNHSVLRSHAAAESGGGVMWGRILEILRKEMLQMLRDPRMRLILFGPAIVELIIYG
jgi:ABC-type multidrug transport system permease subunit